MVEKGEDGSAVTESVGELVVCVPPPRCDHREDQSSTLVEEIVIDVRVVRTDIGGHVRDIECNWTTAAGFEVDEARPVRCVEDVPWMGLAVQELLGRAAASDGPAGAPQRVEQELTPGHVELRCAITVRHETFRGLDPVRDVRCRHVDVAHSRMKSLERVCIVGRREPVGRACVVVGPERDGEAIASVDARFDPGLRGCHGCPRCDELLRQFKFERGHFLADRCDSCECITGEQAQRELVRVLNDGHVVDGQVQSGRCRRHGSHRTRRVGRVHEPILSPDDRRNDGLPGSVRWRPARSPPWWLPRRSWILSLSWSAPRD